MSRGNLLAATIAALIVVLIGVWLREGEYGPLPEPELLGEPPEAPSAASSEVPDVGPSHGSSEVPDIGPSEGSLPRIPPGELADRASLGTGESEEMLARQPTRIDYPLHEKYRDQRWSDVPHQLIAGHDGMPDDETEGPRRLFIALVEPGLSDALIERLVRDLRARHRDAEVLRIRVFDDREAAARPSWTDGGAARDAHMLADLYREPGRESFRVRGAPVRP